MDGVASLAGHGRHKVKWSCKGVSSNILLRIETNEVKSESSECGVTELRSSDFGGTSSERTSASTIDVAPLCNPVLVFRRSEVRSSGVGPVLTECSCKLASINTRGF